MGSLRGLSVWQPPTFPALNVCTGTTNPRLYGCPVPASQVLDGYSMLIMHDWADFYDTYFWKCLSAFIVTWIIVHYLLKYYDVHLHKQADERRQIKRMMELPGTYEQNKKDK